MLCSGNDVQKDEYLRGGVGALLSTRLVPSTTKAFPCPAQDAPGFPAQLDVIPRSYSTLHSDTDRKSVV